MRMTIAEIAQALNYPYLQNGDGIVTGVSIDSRAVNKGDLFVALAGEQTDGHNYLAQALEQGAAGVVISREDAIAEYGLQNYILAEDGAVFLQTLAHWLRQNTDIPVIAVTGSTGKTSTKDFLAAVLAPLGDVVVTKGNHNNELGMPLTICRLEEDTKAMVVEMGMRGLGQIDFLCNIAQPKYGLITNIGKTHCELLGSQENIAQAKCELLSHIPSDGMIALNSSDRALIAPWLDTCKGRIVWYDSTGRDKNAEYRAENIIQHAEGITYELHAGDHSEKIHLAVHGVHNVSNSMAAIAIAREVGVDWKSIVSALAQAKLTGMRLDITKNADGVTVINDAYNANPDSMKSAISVLMNQEGSRKIAVLGDMYELGKYEEQSHREVGNEAAVQHVDYLIAVGQLGALIGESAQMAGCRVDFAKDNAEASSLLRQYIKIGDAVLVKGSRGMKMEQIVQSLMG